MDEIRKKGDLVLTKGDSLSFQKTEDQYSGKRLKKMKKIIAIIIMLHLVALGWLFFRAQSMSQAFSMLGNIFTNFHITAFSIGAGVLFLFYIFPFFLYEVWSEKYGAMAMMKASAAKQTLFYGYIIFMLFFFPSPTAHEFIYFQF